MTIPILKCEFKMIACDKELAEFLFCHLGLRSVVMETCMLPEDLVTAEDEGLFDDCPEELQPRLRKLIEEFGGSEITFSW